MLHFQSSFVGIYVAIIMYFEYISNYIPKKFVDTGLSLAIYLIFIGILVDIIHYYISNINECYSIEKNERIFIMCACMVIMSIIGLFNKNMYTLEIIAILLGKFFWIDTGIDKIKNKYKNKKDSFIKKITDDVISDIGTVRDSIMEISKLLIIVQLTYYLIEIILKKYFMDKISYIFLVNSIGLLIYFYWEFITKISKRANN